MRVNTFQRWKKWVFLSIFLHNASCFIECVEKQSNVVCRTVRTWFLEESFSLYNVPSFFNSSITLCSHAFNAESCLSDTRFVLRVYVRDSIPVSRCPRYEIPMNFSLTKTPCHQWFGYPVFSRSPRVRVSGKSGSEKFSQISRASVCILCKCVQSRAFSRVLVSAYVTHEPLPRRKCAGRFPL